MGVGRHVMLSIVGFLCICAICYNLGSIQLQMESTLIEEPTSKRARLVTGLKSTLKSLVSSESSKGMRKIISGVKISLEHSIESAAQAELGIAARHPAAIAARQAVDEPAQSGREDLDLVVEKRAKQLDAEERLNPSVKHGLFLGGWGKNPPWPFQVITDRQGKDSGAVALCAPFIKYYYNAETEKGLFWRLKADGHIMIGVTSYEFFPGNATNPYTDRSPQERYPEDKQIYASLDGYAHCFRRPSDHIPPAIPRAMVSQSDYIDCSNADLSPKRLPKKYSFAYSNLSGPWNDFNRNFTVAKECAKLAVKEGMMPPLLVGKKKDEGKPVMADIMPLVQQRKVEITDTLPHARLGDAMEQSEFFFIPNLSDASPRVAAEALCRGTPLIMNRHIAGGWKYINDATGVFFDGVDDFLPAIQRLRALKAAGKLKPREWFSANYGPRRSSLRLQAFIELAVGKERLERARQLPRKRW
mmetsp:Transcript_32686/g.84717  ORF Transcript_32686/g.84717 Transcript_32686/m.84717 type:complete len:472 (-) Transcript_32686:1126-2541(-)